MASLSSADPELIDVLQRGLDAYDAGNIGVASRRFDEALEIDPQNVWAMLWKGATSEAPNESRQWLLKVLDVDPSNEHARAGLLWMDRTETGDAASAKAIVARANLDEPSDRLPDALSEDSADTADTQDEPGALPMWLARGQGDDEPLPEWLQMFSVPEEALADQDDAAVGAFGEEPLPAWLRGEEDALAAAEEDDQADDLPDWLQGGAEDGADDERALAAGSVAALGAATVGDASEGDGDLPDWLQDDEAVGWGDGHDFPDWLQGETGAEEGTLAAGEPDATDDIMAAESDFPDWLRGEEEMLAEGSLGAPSTTGEAPYSEDDLPAWLRGEEAVLVAGSLGATAMNDEVTFSEDDLPVWMHGEAEEQGAEANQERVAATDDAVLLPEWMAGGEDDGLENDALVLPAWLRGEDEGTPGAVAEPEVVTPAARHDVEVLPAWLRGEDDEAAPEVPESGLGAPLPSWLDDDVEPLGVEEGGLGDVEDGLPAWLSGEEVVSSSTEVEPSTEWPDWLQDEPTEQALQDREDVALDWTPQDGEGASGVAVADESPAWLTDQESESTGDTAALSYAERQTLYRTGLQAYEDDRLSDAIDAFEQVAAVDSSDVELYNYLGSAYFLADKPNQAIQAFEHAIATDRSYTESYLNLGLVYKEIGQTDQAIALFKGYLEHEQDDESTSGYVRELLDEMR